MFRGAYAFCSFNGVMQVTSLTVLISNYIIFFVRLMERKKVLTGEEGKKSTGTALFNDEEEESDKRNEDSFKDSDPVMNFKLAEIVVDHALQNPAIKDKKGKSFATWHIKEG